MRQGEEGRLAQARGNSLYLQFVRDMCGYLPVQMPRDLRSGRFPTGFHRQRFPEGSKSLRRLQHVRRHIPPGGHLPGKLILTCLFWGIPFYKKVFSLHPSLQTLSDAPRSIRFL